LVMICYVEKEIFRCITNDKFIARAPLCFIASVLVIPKKRAVFSPRALEIAKMKSRFIILCVKACLMAQLGAANVVLMGNYLTLSFDDIEASFSKPRTP
jgi:hypothetical protein